MARVAKTEVEGDLFDRAWISVADRFFGSLHQEPVVAGGGGVASGCTGEGGEELNARNVEGLTEGGDGELALGSAGHIFERTDELLAGELFRGGGRPFTDEGAGPGAESLQAEGNGNTFHDRV